MFLLRNKIYVLHSAVLGYYKKELKGIIALNTQFKVAHSSAVLWIGFVLVLVCLYAFIVNTVFGTIYLY